MTHHLRHLDSLRGLAALTVITEHYLIAYGLPCTGRTCQSLLDTAPLNFWWNGATAVSMFFVLSGFVLSIKYFHSDHQPDLSRLQPLKYLVARLCRIWPPYLAAIVVAGLLYRQLGGQPFPAGPLPADAWLSDTWGGQAMTLAAIARESFLPALPENYQLIPQAWTLGIELNLSLLLPVGLALLAGGHTWLIAASAAAMAALGINFFLLHFLFGLLLARHHAAVAAMLRHPTPRRLTLIAGFLLYAGDLMPADAPEFLAWWQSGLGAALLLACTQSSPRAQALLSQPLLLRFGKISYSAYLLHMLVLLRLTPYVLQALGPYLHHRLGLWLAGYLATLAIVHLVSQLGYRYLETPAIALGKRLAGR